MISVLFSRLVLLVFGTLYPAYASYKTVKTKNVRDYVKWMMYWIVFALYTFIEIFADVFIGFWFPFYYEFKILFVLWLMCPITRGSTFIFKVLINPLLSKNEKKIDACIKSLWDHGYNIVQNVGVQAVDYAIGIVLDLLKKGQIQAINFMPKLTEFAQSPSANSSNTVSSNIENTDGSVFEEEFDMMVESSQFLIDNDVQLSDEQNVQLQNVEPLSKDGYDSLSESESNETSTKSRPLRISTRIKKKTITQNQIKKTK